MPRHRYGWQSQGRRRGGTSADWCRRSSARPLRGGPAKPTLRVVVKGSTSEPPYDWISTSQAADRLGIAHRTLYRRIEREGLPAYRLGRVFRLRAHQVDACLGKRHAPDASSAAATARSAAGSGG